MPKIDASTVAEHHDLHFARLLDAALDYAAEHDVASLTLAELAKRTGRSRASLYAYFGSADEMRVALCTRALAGWVDALIAELRLLSSADARLARFVSSQIADRRDPAVERVSAFVLSLQNEPFRSQVRAALEPLTAELLSIVERLGVEPPTRAATVVQGAIAAAYDQVRAGADPGEVADDTVAFVRAGLSALRSDRPHAWSGDHRAVRGATPGDGAPVAHGPGALAMIARPSFARTAAAAMPSTAERAPMPRTVPTPPRLRTVRVAVAQLGWAVIASATGVTGLGGGALHVALGLSLVAVLIWSARALAAARRTMRGLATMAALAAVASAAALIARSQQVEAALVTHVALVVPLLAGLASIAGVAWHHRRAPVGPPHPI